MGGNAESALANAYLPIGRVNSRLGNRQMMPSPAPTITQTGQRIDETGDHRARDKAHQYGKLRATGDDLQRAGQKRRREQVLQAVILDQGDHDQGHRAGRRRDHALSTTGERDHHGNAERGIQADLRIDPGDDRERDGLRNQGQGHDQPGQHIGTRIGQPMRADGIQQDDFQLAGGEV